MVTSKILTPMVHAMYITGCPKPIYFSFLCPGFQYDPGEAPPPPAEFTASEADDEESGVEEDDGQYGIFYFHLHISLILV